MEISSKVDLFTFFFFPTFDMDKFWKIRWHHWKERQKLEKSQSLKVIRWELMKIQLLKVAKFYRRLYEALPG